MKPKKTQDTTIISDKTQKSRLIMTVLAVRDLKRATRFYKEVFAWTVNLELPVVVKFETPNGHELMLYQREAFGNNTNQMPEILSSGNISGTELYIHVTDLSETILRLKALKAHELSGRAVRPWGDEVAYYADPDGNVLAVAQPLASSAEAMV